VSDPLSDALDALRISTTLFAVRELTGPWGVGFPDAPGAYFHVVRGGPCWLALDETDETHSVGSGDVVLLPRGSAHRLTQLRGGRVRTVFDAETWTPRRLVPAPRPGDRAAARADASDGGCTTELVCGAVRIRNPASHPVLALLPPVVTVRDGTPGADELRLTVTVIGRETARSRPGVDGVVARLGDVLLAQTLRIWAEQHAGDEPGWLAALTDRDVGAVIAGDARRSRRVVDGRAARRHGGHVPLALRRAVHQAGRPAAAGLPDAWRMTKAAMLLQEPQATVQAVGRQVGFRSEPAFNRAFTRHHGVPPGRYRRLALAPGPDDGPDGPAGR
jgi:hypothetical protein